MKSTTKNQSPLDAAVGKLKPALFHAVLFSFFVNFLALAAPLYMMQVYDRAVPSRSVSTLLALTLILAFFMALSSALEAVRSRIFVRAGVLFDQAISAKVFKAVHRTNLISPGQRNAQALRDVDSVREFATSGLIPFCDVPWIPVYILACFALQPIFGMFAVTGALVSLVLSILNDRVSRQQLDKAAQSGIAAQNQAQVSLRNTEVIQAMGMVGTLERLWKSRHDDLIRWQYAASSSAGPLIAATKFWRLFLQSMAIGMGAYLSIRGDITPGAIIAASIIVGKAMTPIDSIIGQWKSFTMGRQSYQRLKKLFDELPPEVEKMSLPVPAGDIDIERVIARVPGTERVVLSNINLSIKRGMAVGVVGPSGAGKSSLVRVLSGVWPVAAGNVRIDGSDLRDWNANELGQHIGYLPQDIELFSGTIAQNISRFREDAADKDIIAAAELAGVHELVQSIPGGYNALVGDNGSSLSGGQRQRIGLARAVFGLPPIIILDEPNSNLDFAGDNSLIQTISKLRTSGITVVFITHKMNLLSQADKILLMNGGQVQAFGDRDEILAAITKANIAKSDGNVQAVGASRAQ